VGWGLWIFDFGFSIEEDDASPVVAATEVFNPKSKIQNPKFNLTQNPLDRKVVRRRGGY